MIKHVVNPTSKDKCLDKERNVLIDKGGSFTRTNAGNYSVFTAWFYGLLRQSFFLD